MASDDLAGYVNGYISPELIGELGEDRVITRGFEKRQPTKDRRIEHSC